MLLLLRAFLSPFLGWILGPLDSRDQPPPRLVSWTVAGNRPFSSSLVPLFQSKSKCETILMKMTLICMKMNLQAELIFIQKFCKLGRIFRKNFGLTKFCSKHFVKRGRTGK